MITDISSAARAARRLDISSTLRSFAVPGGFLLLALQAGPLLSLGAHERDPYAGPAESGMMMVNLGLIVSGALLSLVLAVLVDGAARQPWRGVSTAIALAAGAVSVAIKSLLVIGIAVLAVFLILEPDSRADILSELGIAPLSEQLIGAILFSVFGIAALWLMGRAVQVEGELASGTPRSVLLGDVSGRGFWARLAYIMGLPSSLWRLGAFVAIAFWLFLVARALVYASYAAFQQTTPTQVAVYNGFEEAPAPPVDFKELLLTAAIFFGVLVAGHVLFALAKRFAARRVWAPEKQAARPPILFLRSFEDDQFAFRRPWYDLTGRWFDLWSFRRNVDELLIDEFERYGPVLALGRPGETRTPFGAARRYVSHEDWQAVVRDAASRAMAIVVCTGRTPGLLWEYGYLRDNNLLDKTLFLFPAARAGSPAVHEALDIFGQAMGKTEAPAAGGALISWTRSAEGEQTTVADQPRAQAYLVALRAFIQARARAEGQTVGDRPPRWILLGLLAVISVAAVLAAIIIASNALSLFDEF